MKQFVVLALLATSCTFDVRGLPNGVPDDLSQSPDDLTALPDDLTTFDLTGADLTGADLTTPPDLLTLPDLSPCPPCTTACAPCCRDTFTSGAADTTSCTGTTCLDCEQSCGKNVGTCNLNCSNRATCFSVVDQATTGTGTCDGNSNCHMTCNKVTSGCTIDCTGGAQCRLSCTMTTCSFTSCSGGQQTCANGDITCNEAC